MNIFIEGPRWSGMWTEIIAAALQQLGHQVDCIHHNHKRLTDRLVLAGNTLMHGEPRHAAWTARYRKRLHARLMQSCPDMVLSIQGKIDSTTIQALRQCSPGLKVIFWWGDILSDKAIESITHAADFADRILISYKGIFEELGPSFQDKLVYFPFGVSPDFHTVSGISARERSRFTADVSFVGTRYPERCELIRYLNAQLAAPVRVWGRGWRHCKGIRGHGALSLQDSLKVHACSKISLNLHHAATRNGCNMKYFEIPAAGGLQLCDWQPVMQESAAGRPAIPCRSLPEFAEQIHYYLVHEAERHEFARLARQSVIATTAYPQRLAALLDTLA